MRNKQFRRIMLGATSAVLCSTLGAGLALAQVVSTSGDGKVTGY